MVTTDEAYRELATKVFTSLTPQEQEAVLKYFSLMAGYTIVAGEIMKILKDNKMMG